MPSSDDLLKRPVVPIAGEDDAAATYPALVAHGDPAVCRPLVIHVLGEDAPEAETNRAHEAIERFESLAAADGMTVDSELSHGDSIVDTILEAAEAADASAVVFCSRGGSAWFDLLAGGVRTSLLAKSDTPVVMLPVEGQ
ncbi:universal stress protein [Halohasta salina]|uniref:universal stress protein n=1 Tax=Halohasta salina TaxID=2961621 RepID=UPI0020A3F517|nr:universal stress protein [Halohasta salina]